jgi:TonB family protein
MNTAAARENWEGQLVDGKFPLLKWLGGTERSAVFSTQLPGKNKQAAAIKLLSPDVGTAENQISRWQLAATLEHPNLLQVFHSGQCQVSGTPLIYLVMELAEEDLSVVLQTRQLSPEEAREMIPPMLDALSYLHQKGLVHGRIRPSNIMAVGDQLKLSSDRIHALNDFASRDVSPSAFDAPEVARGVTTRAADIWSLGVTLVRCLSQRAQIRESYNPIEQGMAQTIPEPYRRIARECLRPNPNARCTVTDIRNWLQPAPATATAAAIRQTHKRKSPSIAVMAAIAAVALLAVIFVVRWATHGKPEAPAETAPQQTAPEPAPQQTTAAPSPSPTVAPQASAPAQASPAPVAARAVTPSAPPAYSSPGEVVERALPTVPANASNTITGKIRVSVRVEVNPAGEVTDASFTTPGPSKYFARLAMEASRRWKFKPAESNGQPVASAWILRYQFTQNATDVVPEELPGTTQ